MIVVVVVANLHACFPSTKKKREKNDILDAVHAVDLTCYCQTNH